MTSWASIRIIAAREIRERTRSRIFRIGTFLTVLIVVAAVVFPALARAGQAVPNFTVGVTETTPIELRRAIDDLGDSSTATVSVEEFPTREAAESALHKESVAMVLIFGAEIVTRESIEPGTNRDIAELVGAVQEKTRLFSGLTSAGLSTSDASAALGHPPLPVRGLSPAAPRDAEGATAATSGMVLLFVFLTLYGAFILNGVIEEKSSRVVEILLSTVRPQELLAGKVLGIAAVGTIQGGVLAAATLAARAATPNASAGSLTPEILAYTLLWFAIGFSMYAWLYACAGALVSRTEDAQNLVFPLQVPLVASYGVALISAIHGPNKALTAMSFFPLTAPMTMLERMAADQVPLWQVLVSIALCLATSYFVMRLAVVIFAGGILRSGQRVKLRDAWRNPAS